MWTVDHFKIVNNTAYFAFTKIGSYVQNPPEEIFVMASSDLLLEEGMKSDLSNVSWMMLPDEDHGIRSPLGFNSNSTVIEEGHVLPLSNGNMHIIARTSLGYVREYLSLHTHTNRHIFCSGTSLRQRVKKISPRLLVNSVSSLHSLCIGTTQNPPFVPWRM